MTPSYAEVARELCPYLNHDRCVCPRIARALAAADRAGQERMRERAVVVAAQGKYDWCDMPDGEAKPCANGTDIATELRALPIEEPE